MAGFFPQTSVTRPADTTAYTAGDVVGGVFVLNNAGPNGQPVSVISASLRIDVTAIQSGMTSFRLYLYNVTPPSALADNAAWDLSAGDRASFVGYVDIGSPADLGSTLYCQSDAVTHAMKPVDADGRLYGYLVTNGGYTPAASEVYTVGLVSLALGGLQ